MMGDSVPPPPWDFSGMERNDLLAKDRCGEAGFADLPADAEASFLFRLSLGGSRPRGARLRFTGEEGQQG
jgi:hypothetical protein